MLQFGVQRNFKPQKNVLKVAAITSTKKRDVLTLALDVTESRYPGVNDRRFLSLFKHVCNSKENVRNIELHAYLFTR